MLDLEKGKSSSLELLRYWVQLAVKKLLSSYLFIAKDASTCRLPLEY